MPEEIRVNDYIVADIDEVEIKKTTNTLRISLYWLRLSGFKGRVQVIDGCFDNYNDSSKVLFEIDI